jgi:flagellar motor switch protein FliM
MAEAEAARDDGAVPDSVRSLFEQYCHGLAIRLGTLLRAEVTVHVRGVYQTVYERFAGTLSNPTCLQVMDAPAWGGKLLLELQPSAAFPLLDRLLGGGQLPPPVLRRAMTEIEARLVQRITREFSQQFVKVWPPGTGFELIPEQLFSQAGQLRGESPDAPLLVARLEIAWDEVRGGVQLALPASAAVELVPEP